jgi:putative peptidoglycan lipid II flippase
VAGTNVAMALLLVSRTDAVDTAPALAVAFLSAYVVGSAISYTVLRRVVGGVGTPALVRFLVRMLVVLAGAGLSAWLVTLAMSGLLGDLATDPHPLVSVLRGGIAGLVGLVVVLVLARLLRVREVTSLLDPALARLRRR